MHESLGYPMLANVQTNLQHPATMKLVKWTSIIYLCAKVCDHSPLRAKPSSCGQFNLDEYIYIYMHTIVFITHTHVSHVYIYIIFSLSLSSGGFKPIEKRM